MLDNVCVFDWCAKATATALVTVAKGEKLASNTALNILKELYKERHANIYATHNVQNWAPCRVIDVYSATQTVEDALLNCAAYEQPSHVVIGQDGGMVFLIDLSDSLIPVQNNESCESAIVTVNCGFIKKTISGFCLSGGSNGDTVYHMKREVAPQCIDGVWFDPFETRLIVSSIVLRRLLIAAYPTISKSSFTNYGRITFKNAGKQSPLWPFAAINTLAFNNVNLNDIKSLHCSELSLSAVKQFSYTATKK